MRRLVALTSFVAFLGLSVFASANDDLHLSAGGVFDGSLVTSATTPVRVTISNSGDRATGYLRVTSGSITTAYPVDLPKYGQSSVTVYPVATWSGVRYELDTDQGSTSQLLPAPTYVVPEAGGVSPQNILVISDDSANLSAAVSTQGQVGLHIQNAHVHPDNAPTRPLAYAGISAVILGGGSEKLSDASIKALKTFALTGGSIIFVGSPYQAAAKDPRWKDVVPVANLHDVQVKESADLDDLTSSSIDGPITLTVGTPVRDSTVVGKASQPIVVSRGWGLGRAIFYAFNPFGSQIGSDGSMAYVLARTLKVADENRSKSLLSGATTGFYQQANPTNANDPFSAKLPSALEILKVLVGYFVVVVPINFLILRKMKKGEFAWFTAPILSLACAGILFKSADHLYSAKQATSTQGWLVAQEGYDDGTFIGASQLFIPRAGTYDLRLHRVDSIGDMSETYLNLRDTTDSSYLHPVDVGEIECSKIQASNLAFRQFSYRQAFDTRGWFSSSRKPGGKLTITNNSPYDLVNGQYVIGYTAQWTGDLPRGKSVTFKPNASMTKTQSGDTAGLPSIAGPNNRTVLTGNMKGIRPGPQLGQQLDDRTSIQLAYFFKETQI